MYKNIIACNPRCSRRRRIDEADISAPGTVDQRAANCLKEAERSSTTLWSRCRRTSFPSSTASFLVLVGPRLSNLHHCETIPLHTSSYCVIGKSSFSKADNPPRSNSRNKANYWPGWHPTHLPSADTKPFTQSSLVVLTDRETITKLSPHKAHWRSLPSFLIARQSPKSKFPH
ncbi:hypothetical protein TNCV_3834841 [Trichonephila clavipes]|nr:hypothetical protein TNCV_3834841 [Trichonephila clavipes]